MFFLYFRYIRISILNILWKLNESLHLITALLFCFPHAEPSPSFSSSLSGARLNTTCETTVSIPEDSDEHQEVIEVQILPQVS